MTCSVDRSMLEISANITVCPRYWRNQRINTYKSEHISSPSVCLRYSQRINTYKSEHTSSLTVCLRYWRNQRINTYKSEHISSLSVYLSLQFRPLILTDKSNWIKYFSFWAVSTFFTNNRIIFPCIIREEIRNRFSFNYNSLLQLKCIRYKFSSQAENSWSRVDTYFQPKSSFVSLCKVVVLPNCNHEG